MSRVTKEAERTAGAHTRDPAWDRPGMPITWDYQRRRKVHQSARIRQLEDERIRLVPITLPLVSILTSPLLTKETAP